MDELFFLLCLLIFRRWFDLLRPPGGCNRGEVTGLHKENMWISIEDTDSMQHQYFLKGKLSSLGTLKGLTAVQQ